MSKPARQPVLTKVKRIEVNPEEAERIRALFDGLIGAIVEHEVRKEFGEPSPARRRRSCTDPSSK